MVKKLKSDRIAHEYNFTGKGSKCSFAALHLKTVICGMFVTLNNYSFLNLIIFMHCSMCIVLLLLTCYAVHNTIQLL